MRQRRLGIDDFGVPLDSDPSFADDVPAPYRDEESGGVGDGETEGVPGLVLEEEGLDVGAVSKALQSALGEAAAADVREGTEVDERAPLLVHVPAQGKGKSRAGWW